MMSWREKILYIFKNKIQLNKFKDQIGFIQQCINQVIFLRGAEAIFKLRSKSWLGDVDLAQVMLFWACYFLLTTIPLDQTQLNWHLWWKCKVLVPLSATVL